MYTSIQKIMVLVTAFIFSMITIYMMVSNVNSLKYEWSLQEFSFYFVLFIAFGFQASLNYEFLKSYKLAFGISAVFMAFNILCASLINFS